MRIAIVQSNYIPWKGYYDIINSVDKFVVLDDVQYTRRDWRNRNLIYTSRGLEWLTIPVETKGKFHQRINETRVSGNHWARSHWKKIAANYNKARYFDHFSDIFQETYLKAETLKSLSEINMLFITTINGLLEIGTKITQSNSPESVIEKDERLLSICRKEGAQTYLSGPLARGYIDEQKFKKAGINVEWVDYSGYPEYKQLHMPFRHEVSIIDLLFNTGENAPTYMKKF